MLTTRGRLTDFKLSNASALTAAIATLFIFSSAAISVTHRKNKVVPYLAWSDSIEGSGLSPCEPTAKFAFTLDPDFTLKNVDASLSRNPAIWV